MRIGKYIKGFTLIEIMVVISIIAFLSSVVFANLAIAKIKAQDSARTQTAKQVDLAIKSYILDKKVAPQNYTSNGEFAFSDAAPDGTGMNAFQKSMKILVDAGYLSKIPDQIGGVPFFYYNSGAQYGAIFGTSLVAVPASTVGGSNTCRPYTALTSTQCDTLMADNSFTGCTSSNFGHGPQVKVCGPETPYPSLQYCPAFIASRIDDIQTIYASFPINTEADYLYNTVSRPFYYTYGVSFAQFLYLVNQGSASQQRCSTSSNTDVCYCSPI